MELEQGRPVLSSQGLLVPRSELLDGMTSFRDLVNRIIGTPTIIKYVFIMLTGYCVDFPFGVMFVKQRCYKKLAEAVECPFKSFVRNLKKIVRDCPSGVGVACARVLG